MTDAISIAPPNSLVLLMDPDTGVLPETLNGASIASTSSAVVIGTLVEFDGETEIVLCSPEGRPSDGPGMACRWRGHLATSGKIAVVTVHNEVLIERSAPLNAYVEIWTNDEREPDSIFVTVS